MTTFSSKALSFYSGDYEKNVMNGTGQNAMVSNILIQSADRVNFATHDQQLTTNREEKETTQEIGGMGQSRMPGDQMRTTASGTLNNLIQDLKYQQTQLVEAPVPQKQSKKYCMNLG